MTVTNLVRPEVIDQVYGVSPLKLTCKRLRKNIGSFLLAGDILQVYLQLLKHVIQPGKAHSVSAIQMSQGRGPAGR